MSKEIALNLCGVDFSRWSWVPYIAFTFFVLFCAFQGNCKVRHRSNVFCARVHTRRCSISKKINLHVFWVDFLRWSWVPHDAFNVSPTQNKWCMKGLRENPWCVHPFQVHSCFLAYCASLENIFERPKTFESDEISVVYQKNIFSFYGNCQVRHCLNVFLCMQKVF